MASPRSSRSGVLLVLGLLALGVVGALLARRYRIPGTVPRVLVVPDTPPGEEGRPAPDLPEAELAARIVVVERTTGVPLPLAELTTDAPGVTVLPVAPDAGAVRTVRFLPAVHRRGAAVSFLLREVGREPVPVTIRVEVTTRSDRGDLDLQRLELRPPGAPRGLLDVSPPAGGTLDVSALETDGTVRATCRVGPRSDGRPVRLLVAPGRHRVGTGEGAAVVTVPPGGSAAVAEIEGNPGGTPVVEPR